PTRHFLRGPPEGTDHCTLSRAARRRVPVFAGGHAVGDRGRAEERAATGSQQPDSGHKWRFILSYRIREALSVSHGKIGGGDDSGGVARGAARWWFGRLERGRPDSVLCRKERWPSVTMFHQCWYLSAQS